MIFYTNRPPVRRKDFDAHFEAVKRLTLAEMETAPEKWLPVLDRWKKRRIKFARLGGGDQLGEKQEDF